MTFMPIIDDHMLALFRRTGKRRGSYRQARSGRVMAGGTRVTLQSSVRCPFGQTCFTPRGEVGICDERGHCIVDPFPGGFQIPR